MVTEFDLMRVVIEDRGTAMEADSFARWIVSTLEHSTAACADDLKSDVMNVVANFYGVRVDG